MNEKDLNSKKHSAWRPRRSCWIVACLIIIPAWVLVAIPGDNVCWNRNTEIDAKGYLHGWPLTHATSVRAELSQVAALQIPQSGIKSTSDALDVLGKRLDQFAFDTLRVSSELNESKPIFNARLTTQKPSPIAANSNFEPFPWCSYVRNMTDFEHRQLDAFWYDTINWPLPDGQRGFALRWNFFALVGNLSVVILAIYVFAIATEYRRRRRGSWFRLSVFEFLISVASVAAMIALFKTEYDRSAKELQAVAGFTKFETFNDSAERTNKIPPVVLALFNNQQSLPGTNVPLWNPLMAVRVNLSPGSLVPDASRQRIQEWMTAIAKFECPVYLNLRHHHWQLFKEVQLHNVTKIGYTFDSRFTQVYPFDSDREHDDTLERFVTKINQFSELTAIQLMLCDSQQQRHQLIPFIETSIVDQLDSIEIWGVGETGAEYLLSIDSKIAHKTQIKTINGVPEGLREKLSKAGFTIVESDFYY